VDSKAEMRVERNGTKYSACALRASRCEWSEGPGHRKRGARWTGAGAGWFGAFFARTVRRKKQGLEVVSKWSVLERMNDKGVCVRW